MEGGSARSLASCNWPQRTNRPPRCFSDGGTQTHTTACKWALKRAEHMHFQRTDAWVKTRWRTDNETAKSLILRIISFFCSAASSGQNVNQRLEWNKLCSKILFPKHVRLWGREMAKKKSNYFPLLSLHSWQIRHALWEPTKFSSVIAVLPPASSANSQVCLCPPVSRLIGAVRTDTKPSTELPNEGK